MCVCVTTCMRLCVSIAVGYFVCVCVCCISVCVCVLIDSCPLPITMNCKPYERLLSSKSSIQHPYSQTHFNGDKTVSMVRRWIGFNLHSTRDVLFHRARGGGLRVPNIEWVYVAARVSNLLRMLNRDDSAVRELARAPLHLRRNKAPPSTSEDASFLGFKKKPNGKLDTNTPGFGVRIG